VYCVQLDRYLVTHCIKWIKYLIICIIRFFLKKFYILLVFTWIFRLKNKIICNYEGQMQLIICHMAYILSILWYHDNFILLHLKQLHPRKTPFLPLSPKIKKWKKYNGSALFSPTKTHSHKIIFFCVRVPTISHTLFYIFLKSYQMKIFYYFQLFH